MNTKQRRREARKQKRLQDTTSPAPTASAKPIPAITASFQRPEGDLQPVKPDPWGLFLDAIAGGARKEIDRLTAAVPASYRPSRQAEDFLSTAFFVGARDLKWIPRNGIDMAAARHNICSTILKSFDIPHEVKMKTACYLLELWMESISYVRGDA